jgi:hypothetical protein
MTMAAIMATKVEPITKETFQAEEPEIVIAAAVPQGEAFLPSSPENTPLNSQQQRPHNDTGFDILCCGDDTRKGMRVRPGTNFVMKLCGNTNIILPENPPEGAHYRFIMMNLCGDARFLVSKGAKVILRRIALCGNRTVETDEVEETASSPITVKVTIIQLCGDVKIGTF